MAELNKTATKPILRLLKTAVNPKQKISNSSTTTDVSTLSSITIKPDCECREGGPYFKKEGKTGKSLNSAIIGSLAFFLVLSCFISLWLTLRMRKLRNSNEQRDAGAVEMELPTVPNSVSPEMVDEEIENDLYGVVITPRTRLFGKRQDFLLPDMEEIKWMVEQGEKMPKGPANLGCFVSKDQTRRNADNVCVLVVHYNFENAKNKNLIRKGDAQDVNNLERTFRVNRNCNFRSISSPEKGQLLHFLANQEELLRLFGSSEVPSVFVLYILSHGDRDGIIFTDHYQNEHSDELIFFTTTEIFESLKRLTGFEECLKFINFGPCRGELGDQVFVANHKNVAFENENSCRITYSPLMRNTVVFFSTVETTRAKRNQTGTTFALLTCQVLNSLEWDESLVNVLANIQYESHKNLDYVENKYTGQTPEVKMFSQDKSFVFSKSPSIYSAPSTSDAMGIKIKKKREFFSWKSSSGVNLRHRLAFLFSAEPNEQLKEIKRALSLNLDFETSERSLSGEPWASVNEASRIDSDIGCIFLFLFGQLSENLETNEVCVQVDSRETAVSEILREFIGPKSDQWIGKPKILFLLNQETSSYDYEMPIKPKMVISATNHSGWLVLVLHNKDELQKLIEIFKGQELKKEKSLQELLASLLISDSIESRDLINSTLQYLLNFPDWPRSFVKLNFSVKNSQGTQETNFNFDSLVKDSARKNQTWLLSSDAGTGKTTILREIAFQLGKLYPELKILRVSLPRVHLSTQRKNANDEIEILAKATHNSHEDISKSVENKQCVVFLDGFDETGSQEKMLKIIEALEKKQISLWIGTRPHAAEAIQKRISKAVLVKIDPLNQEQQIELFQQETGMSKGDCEEFITKFTSKDILKNPLHLSLVAQYRAEGNLYQIYDQVVRHKVEDSLIREGYDKNNQNTFPGKLDTALESLQQLASCHIRGVELIGENKTNLEKINCYGIATFENNKVIFIHQTFSEFLAAQQFLREIEDGDGFQTSKEDAANLFLGESFSWCRKFVDLTNSQLAKEKTKSGQTGLHILLYFRYDPLVEKVRFLVEEIGVDIRAKDNNGCTALRIAVSEEMGCVDYLMTKDINLGVKNKRGLTCLHLAAVMGNIEALQSWIELGGDLDVVDGEGSTALHYAARGGHLQFVKKLLAFAAENAKNPDVEATARRGAQQSTQQEEEPRERGTRLDRNMSPFFAAIFVHSLCLASAINFTSVYEWDKFDFNWPYGKIRQDFDPKNVYLQNMAVFERRLFLSLNLNSGIPATLVWVPTSGTSATPPKLSPFPAWHLHEKHNCHTIQRAKGMETDSGGRLWVLDNGSWECPKSKLWIFDMLDIDEAERVHEFPDAVVSHTYKTRTLRNIVLDKTPDDSLAYITESESEHLVVYSRKLDKSWTVKTSGRKWYSLALSPNRDEATKLLYLSRAFSYELYSVAVSELKNEGGNAAVKLIGEWTSVPYRMLIDSANVLYAAFYDKNYLSIWNISEPFREQRFHEVGRLGAFYPFTIALDTTNTLWLTERNQSGGANETRNKLLKAEVDARSDSFSMMSTASTTPQVIVNEETSDAVRSTQSPTNTTETPQLALQLNETSGGYACLVGDPRKIQSSNTVVIFLLVCCLVLSGIVILWLTLRMRRMQTSSMQIPMENNDESTSRDSFREAEATARRTAQHTTRREAAREARPRSKKMSPFLAAILLHGLCVANAVNFTTVYEWDKFDFVWPSGADTSIEEIKQNFNPANVHLQYVAVFGERLFISLIPQPGIPATLVWLPTSGASTAPPKLAPFPSWDLHRKDNCETIQAAKGMETDTDGRLWVLDQGSKGCQAKLWIFDLAKNDTIERVHQFADAVVSHAIGSRWLLDIVLDKTADDCLAYIVDSISEHLVVYSRKMDKSWSVEMPRGNWFSLALSRNKGQLYLARDGSEELYSVSVSELKNDGGSGSAAVKFIGKWKEEPYRMLIDSANVLYAAFNNQNYLSQWNISEPFGEQRIHEVGRLDAGWPFAFFLDTNGNLWITERNKLGGGNRYKLLKAAVGSKSYQFSTSTGN
ncbi:Hypothetical predicted protein [Cloeon dipterum]|nr:Hypothetical predicted protein [Cloeon dipterum]